MADHFLPLIDLEQSEVIVSVVQRAEVYQPDRISKLVSRLLAKFGDLPGPSSQRPFEWFDLPGSPNIVQWNTFAVPDEEGLV